MTWIPDYYDALFPENFVHERIAMARAGSEKDKAAEKQFVGNCSE